MFVVEEVRAGRQKLAVKTIYKVATEAESATAEAGVFPTSEKIPGQPPESKSTREQPKVKTESKDRA